MLIKNVIKIGIVVILFVVIFVIIIRIIKSKMGVKFNGLGVIEFGVMFLFLCIENFFFGFYCLLVIV